MKKILAIIILITCTLLVVQARSYRDAKNSGVVTSKNIISEVSVFQLANQEMRKTVADEHKKIDILSSQLAEQSIVREIDALRLAAGLEAVTGEGIEVTIDKSVPAFWVVDLLAQLTSSGAEVLAINGNRYLDRTAGLRDVSGGLLMRSNFLRPPYTISVIGPQIDLRNAVSQTGGFVDRIKKAFPDLKVIVAQRDSIVIR